MSKGSDQIWTNAMLTRRDNFQLRRNNDDSERRMFYPKHNASMSSERKNMAVAIYYDNVETMALYWEQTFGKDPNCFIYDEATGASSSILRYACKCGSEECVRYLLDNGMNLVKLATSRVVPDIFEAMEHPVIISMLLDRGVSVNSYSLIYNRESRHILTHALLFNHFTTAHVLLDRGADRTQANNDEYTFKKCERRVMRPRKACRHVSLLVIGMSLNSRLACAKKIDKNIYKIMGKHVWSMRMDATDAWFKTAKEEEEEDAKAE